MALDADMADADIDAMMAGAAVAPARAKAARVAAARVPVEAPCSEAPAPSPIDPRTMPARIHNLKAAGVAGAHCLHSFRGDDRQTLARRLGSGTHALLTGKSCVMWEQESKASAKRRAKAKTDGKPLPAISMAPRSGDDFVKFCARNPGAVILNRKEMAAAERMRDAIMADGHARRLLEAPGVVFERTIQWTQLGRARQSTPDLRSPGGADGRSFNCEIKTTRCAAPFPFGRDAKKLAYHAQLADQAAAIKYETGSAPRTSYIIAVESSPPHVVQVYEVPDDILEQGAQLCTMWLERLQMYEATNMWHGYSPRIETLEFFDFNAPVPANAPPEFEEEEAGDD